MYLKKSFFPNDLFIAHLSFFFLFISNMFHQLSQLHERINEIIKFLGAEVAGELRLRFSAIQEGFTKMGIPHIGANVCLKMAEEELNELGEQLRRIPGYMGCAVIVRTMPKRWKRRGEWKRRLGY
jgi:hypothetical protein